MCNQQFTTLGTASGAWVGPATGFALASPGQAIAANIDSALARNRTFAAAGGHQGAVVFPTCACS
jgi:hypothetical protein